MLGIRKFYLETLLAAMFLSRIGLWNPESKQIPSFPAPEFRLQDSSRFSGLAE
jgi:hypothetical protein